MDGLCADARRSLDAVALTGYVYVVTHVPAHPQGPIRIHVNLDQVADVGECHRVAVCRDGSASESNFPSLPPDPLHLGFDLQAWTPRYSPGNTPM